MLNTFPQLTYLRLCYRPFETSTLDHLLSCVPSLRRLSIETLVYSTDYIRSTFWTVLLQKHLPLLERIRLIVRGWFVLKTSNNTNDEKLDEINVIDSYRYDPYWRDRTFRHIFKCLIDSSAAVLEIR